MMIKDETGINGQEHFQNISGILLPGSRSSEFVLWSNGFNDLGRWVSYLPSSPGSSVEKLCSVDLNASDSAIQLDRMEPLLSACRQIHKAGYLSSILNSQVFHL